MAPPSPYFIVSDHKRYLQSISVSPDPVPPSKVPTVNCLLVSINIHEQRRPPLSPVLPVGIPLSCTLSMSPNHPVVSKPPLHLHHKQNTLPLPLMPSHSLTMDPRSLSIIIKLSSSSVSLRVSSLPYSSFVKLTMAPSSSVAVYRKAPKTSQTIIARLAKYAVIPSLSYTRSPLKCLIPPKDILNLAPLALLVPSSAVWAKK